jgi:hypothetical protein
MKSTWVPPLVKDNPFTYVKKENSSDSFGKIPTNPRSNVWNSI